MLGTFLSTETDARCRTSSSHKVIFAQLDSILSTAPPPVKWISSFLRYVDSADHPYSSCCNEDELDHWPNCQYDESARAVICSICFHPLIFHHCLADMSSLGPPWRQRQVRIGCQVNPKLQCFPCHVHVKRYAFPSNTILLFLKEDLSTHDDDMFAESDLPYPPWGPLLFLFWVAILLSPLINYISCRQVESNYASDSDALVSTSGENSSMSMGQFQIQHEHLQLSLPVLCSQLPHFPCCKMNSFSFLRSERAMRTYSLS